MKWRLDPGQIEVVDEDVARILRGKQTWERAEMVFAAYRTGRLIVEASVRRQHPDWPDDAVAREVARRMSRGAT